MIMRGKSIFIAISIYTILFLGLFGAIMITAHLAPSRKVFLPTTGECYHRRSCQTLNYTPKETSLQNAIESGYRMCKVCKPPTLYKASAEDRSFSSLFQTVVIFPFLLVLLSSPVIAPAIHLIDKEGLQIGYFVVGFLSLSFWSFLFFCL